jgi:LmbE family N-acetylglucosaminyl deacetylase
MKSSYDALYLSPHLDDAILSCGGQIFQIGQAGGSVLIVSIMAGDAPAGGLSDFAQSLHDRWELASNASAIRREEDRAACQILGADYYHLDLLDCIYRQDPASGVALYDSEDSLFGALHPAEEALAGTLADTLAQLPDSEHVFAPLTAGHHVDHQFTRLAAEIWKQNSTLIYYEEYPYALSDNAMPVGVDDEAAWRALIVALTGEALAARIEAITCYRSQLSTFFRDHDDLTRSVSNYVQEVGGERLWHRIVL